MIERNWDPTKISIEAAKYTTRDIFKVKAYGAYTKAGRLGIMDEVCSHMIKQKEHGNFKLLQSVPGIYSLLLDNKIVYIGKANTCMKSRVSQHYGSSRSKVFNKVVAYKIIGDANINVAEVYLINKLKPLHNEADKGNSLLTLVIPNIDDIIEKEIIINL